VIPASVAVAPRRSSHAAIIGRAAVRALYTELALSPKPGLVSPLDSGAHDDMDMTTFMRSLFALRGYFCAIAAAGAAGADFTDLQALGMRAERRMLEATRGINTHRGAIFSLGLLAGAAGWLHAEGQSFAGDALGRCIARRWGAAIVRAGEQAGSSHGVEAVRRYGARGAREEAAAGFPLLFDFALPTLVHSLARRCRDGPGANPVCRHGRTRRHQPAPSWWPQRTGVRSRAGPRLSGSRRHRGGWLAGSSICPAPRLHRPTPLAGGRGRHAGGRCLRHDLRTGAMGA